MYPGKRVWHRKFGAGTVYYAKSRVIAVEFDSGTVAGVWHYSLFGI